MSRFGSRRRWTVKGFADTRPPVEQEGRVITEPHPPGGRDGPHAELIANCYDDLRRMARRLLANDQVADVFQPTDLANEAAIRLLRAQLGDVEEAGHLLAIAARTMRQIMIDEARKRLAGKRQVVTRWPDERDRAPVNIADLHDAMAELQRFSPNHAEVVELRFMLGLTLTETVAVTGLSQRTVTRRWQSARAWLLDHLGDHGDG